jgi:hypothetical protein
MVAVGVKVLVGVLVGVKVLVGVLVAVAVFVGVLVAVGVNVEVGVGVLVGVNVLVGVLVAVSDGITATAGSVGGGVLQAASKRTTISIHCLDSVRSLDTLASWGAQKTIMALYR